MPCKIGIKYCGGCNPNYNRVAAMERIRSCLGPEVEFVRYDCKDAICILIIKGCDTECIDLNGYGQTHLIMLSCWEDIQSVIAQIKNLSQQEETFYVE